MKSYLSLILISAKVRRRQSRMTLLCIIMAVLLITAVFSIADMMIRTERDFMLNKHGNWHVKLEQISPDAAAKIRERPDVAAVGAACVFNFDGREAYYVNGKRAVLYGTDETYMDRISNGITDGAFPQAGNEVMLSPNAAAAFQAQPGGSITLHTPAGDMSFTVSGFGTEDKGYYDGQTFLVGVYMTQAAFSHLMEQNGVTDHHVSYYVQFTDAAAAAKAIPELQAQWQLPDGAVSENTGVMGMAGQSGNKVVKNFYGIAAILFLLVLSAGVLMISGSMNSNIAQRTQFFGMMRCIGASRRQIIRFVRWEALYWCKTAVPAGVILGTVISWIICAILHYGIGGEFETTPVFQISPAGLISGAAVGLITVLLAAQSPAKRAARVSPISAVSGNSELSSSVRSAVKTGFGRIEFALGIHHAAASKKNWCLMTASFALTIILFLSFSVVLDMMRLLIPSLNVTSADMVLGGYNNELILDRDLVDEIKKINGVEAAYGSSYMSGIPASSSREGISRINIVSYDDVLLDYAKESVSQGSLDEVYGDSNKVATVFNKNNSLQVSDTIQLAGTEVEISCALSQGLFGDDLILICSQETFDRLMGETNYGLIGVKLSPDAGDETAAQIRQLETGNIIVTDQRKSNRQNTATYWASRIVCYGFLAIIGIITIFNIINTISMSVSARIKQYGAMRAVGMDSRQLTGMISAEAVTYAVSGLLFGLGTGIPFNRFLYRLMVTSHFGIRWKFQVPLLLVILVFVSGSAVIAVNAPVRRIRNMSITETINEL